MIIFNRNSEKIGYENSAMRTNPLRLIQPKSLKKGPRKRFRQFDFLAFIARGFFCAFLVFSTYNPSEISLFHWIKNQFTEFWALQIPLIIVLLILFYLIIRASILMLRISGALIVAAILISLVWVLKDFGLINLENRIQLELTILLSITGFFTVGVSAMSIYTRLTGQLNLEDLTS